jgi:hypothetical protein
LAFEGFHCKLAPALGDRKGHVLSMTTCLPN